MLTKKQVQHIASLARIKLDDETVDKYAKELSSILDYVDQLDEVETEGIEPLPQVAGLKNVWRKDSLQKDQCLNQEQALSNAPEREQGYFKVKSVF